MSRKTLRLACAVVALSCPAFAQQSPPQPGNAPAPSAKADVEFGDPADARHDPRSGETGRGQQARRGRGQHGDRLADQPARQCLVCSGTVDADRADRQRLPDGAELFRPHGPAVADRVGHQLQSGRTGEQRQLQPGSGGRRRSCRRQRRFLCLHAHSRLERPAGGRGVFAAARRAPGHAQGRAEADLVHAGRGRGNLRRRSHGAGGGARSERQGSGDRPGRARHRFALSDRDARWRAARRGRAARRSAASRRTICAPGRWGTVWCCAPALL